MKSLTRYRSNDKARHISEFSKHYSNIQNFPIKEKCYKHYFERTQSFERVGKSRVVDKPTDEEIFLVKNLFTKKFDDVNHTHKFRARLVVMGNWRGKMLKKYIIYP